MSAFFISSLGLVCIYLFCCLGFADTLPISSSDLIHIAYVIEGYSSVLALCFYHDTVSQSIVGYPLGACRFLLGVG